MKWVLPLSAISQIPDFNSAALPSKNHFLYTAEPSSKLWPWKTFKTSPHTPPRLHTHRYVDLAGLAPGYVFLTPSNANGADGTYELSGTGFIFTPDGDLVFAGEEHGMGFCDEWIAGMTDFRKQEYNGRPYLTYWNGCNTLGKHWGHRWGRVTFVDEEYDSFTINPDLNINTLDDATRGQIDVHEHHMTDRGTMMVTTYNNTRADLRFLNGTAESWVADSMFFEIDIKTQRVLFQWSAKDHISWQASRFRAGRVASSHEPWDWFHINSVQAVGKDYLISARHHFALYLISGEDGHVIWKLDGIDGGSFGSIPTRFKWQHHARAHNVTEHGMTVSLFDNHVDGRKNFRTQSRALAFWLPMPAHRDNPPHLIKDLHTREQQLFSATQGSYQMDLGNGNGFVGYGKVPIAREYGPAGNGSDLRWQGQFGEDGAVMSYRAFKATWHGTPKHWDPTVLFEEVRNAAPEVYVSWNGATDIWGWAVFAGDSEDNLKSIGVARKMGFETVFELKHARCVQLGAIRNGKIIRASNVACIQTAEDFDVNKVLTGQSNVERLEAERTHLLNELNDLEQEMNELEAGSMTQYHLFVAVACLVVLLAAGTWTFSAWRNWRKRRQYQSVAGSEPPQQSDSLLPFDAVGFAKRQDSILPAADDFDDTKLDDFSESDDEETGRESLRDAKVGIERERSVTSHARMPFIRQETNSHV